MADEAVCVEAPKLIVRRTVANAVAIPKGTILELDTGTNLASPSNADNDKFGGIAIEEKVANDGITEIGAAMDGVWKLDATAAAITSGQMVNLAGANQINAAADGDLEVGSLVGRAEQTTAGSEMIRVRLLGF